MRTDWTVLELDGVTDVAENAARHVARQYKDVTEYDDMLQEAYLLLATDEKVRDYIDSDEVGLGALRHRIVQRLQNGLRDSGALRDSVSLERLRESVPA